MSRFLPFFLFFLLFIFESIFVELLPSRFFQSDSILVPHFLLTGLLLLTIYGSKKQGILYGFLFGLLFDIAYTEIIGIYFFMFPLIAYLVSKIMKILQSNLFISSIVVLLGMTILEILVYYMNVLIHITNMDFVSFFNFRLIPTIILNVIFVVIVVYPMKKQFEKLAEELVP